MYRFFHLLVAISLILSSIAPASVASATTIASSTSPAALVNAKTATSTPAAVPQTASSALPAGYAAYLAPADAQPLMRAIPRDLPTIYGIAAEQQQDAGPYRTTVKVRGVADLARLKALGATILNATAYPVQAGRDGSQEHRF